MLQFFNNQNNCNMCFINIFSLLIIITLVTSLHSQATVSTSTSASGGSLTEEVKLVSQPLQNQEVEENSSLSVSLYSNNTSAVIPPTSNEKCTLCSPEFNQNSPQKIDLVKRMLEKTRHIQAENRRLRRRSPIPQQGSRRNRNRDGVSFLNPRAIQEGAFQDGKETATQAPSLISKNNFINFCVSRFGKVGGAVIMNGKQQNDKPACNGIPMGMVPDKNHLPACKFVSPKNLDVIKANETFEVTLALRNLVVGIFTNPKNTYLEAPLQLDPETKAVLGHTHIVVQSIDSLNSTKIPDPTLFFFFKGIDDAATDGKVSVNIDGGLPPGFWRISTINTGANHQAISSPIAQRSIYDDIIYITSE